MCSVRKSSVYTVHNIISTASLHCYFFIFEKPLGYFFHSLGVVCVLFIYHSFSFFLFLFLSSGSHGVAWEFGGVDGEISPLLYFSISVCHQYISRLLYIYIYIYTLYIINTTTDAAISPHGALLAKRGPDVEEEAPV